MSCQIVISVISHIGNRIFIRNSFVVNLHFVFHGQCISNGDIKRTRQSLFTVCTDMMETYTVAILVYGRIPDDIAVTFTSAVKIVFAFVFFHLIHMSVNHDLCIFCPVSVSSDDCTKITGSLLIILHIIISKQYIFASALCIRSKD